MHLAIYRQRNDVEAVIHSHPPVATAFACSGLSLDKMLCQEAVMILGTVPLARYATTGTDEVAASLSPHIPNHEAILMANHGAVTYGSSLLDAFLKMETLEHLAQVRLLANQLGGVRTLDQRQAELLIFAKEKHRKNIAWAKRTVRVKCTHQISPSRSLDTLPLLFCGAEEKTECGKRSVY
jgi:L-fuculose-phosphate aldolase